MSAQRIELVASATQTASGNSAAFAVNTATMGSLGVDVTAENMTDFDAWLEGSDDGGTTWYPIPPDSITVDSTRAVTRNPTSADVVVSHAAGAEKFTGEFKHLPWDRVRLAWALTGTDITFSASLVVK
jgi:hypothetical protein